ncbi:hypothetical protein PG989_012825 [Apiospora arundinis]
MGNTLESSVKSTGTNDQLALRAHPFNGEHKCKSTVCCNRARDIQVQLHGSKSAVVINGYKKGEDRPSKLLAQGKGLIVGGIFKLLLKYLDKEMAACEDASEDASKKWIPKILRLDAFGKLADTKGSYTLTN